MKDEELRESPPPIKFDNTMLSTYVACPRKLYWFMRRVVRLPEPGYFSWGRAFGAGINEWHRLQDSGLLFSERLLYAQNAAGKEWQKEAPDPLSLRPNDSWENLLQILEQYAAHYGEEEQWTVVAPEVGFSFPIRGTEFVYCGSLDCYIEWPGYGRLLREDKSTGMYITKSYVKQWSVSSQVTGYIWAASQVYGEIPFGALMNMVSKKPRKDPSDKFVRTFETRSEFQINQWLDTAVLKMAEINLEWERWIWPKLGQFSNVECYGGTGKAACQYAPLCWQEQEFTKVEIREPYAELDSPWAPWEREGENE